MEWEYEEMNYYNENNGENVKGRRDFKEGILIILFYFYYEEDEK